MNSIPPSSLQQALDALWVRFLPELQQRIAVLEEAGRAFAARRLSQKQHEAANIAAHKLAGVLGTFGLTKGTVLARELEILYSRENGPDPAIAEQLGHIAAQLRAIVEGRK